MRTPHESSVGQIGFIKKHELWTAEQQEAADALAARLQKEDIRRVRISWSDQHGIVRGKTLTTPDFLLALRNGQDFQTASLDHGHDQQHRDSAVLEARRASGSRR